MVNVKDITLKSVIKTIENGASDLLSNSDFISRTIGMNNSYEDLMFIVQSLGREPISLLGKDYAFIYDHVRRNYLQGTYVNSKFYGDNSDNGCYKFTFYKEVPTVRFANPYEDPMNYLGNWVADFETQTTMVHGQTIHYSEANNGKRNIVVDYHDDIEFGNPGVASPGIASYGPDLSSCDLIKKTNDNFNHGKYETLISRFHTNSEESKSQMNPTQTANSKKYGLSHGRNLLKMSPDESMGYDNPYCRVWTYHHQYNQIARQIRPFDEEYNSQDKLESAEMGSHYGDGGFRTIGGGGFNGGSSRLDTFGVLNYKNGTVNIAPTAKISDYFNKTQSEYDKHIIETKKCMFSIENLAWRDTKTVKNEYDELGLSPEQKGPLGGRIMWFPPYEITFNESVTVNWNPNQFIGRGEKIYTYTDTERTGTLNFTLLIDHPSILDYWSGHYRNSGKNKGRDLTEGNSGGVDNKDNQENTLLRFFAGCDILTAEPQKYKLGHIDDGKDEPPNVTSPTPTEPDENKDNLKKTICAILYYPNNYSGKDDGGDKVNPIYYLMNGVGTQKYVNQTTKEADDIPTTVSIKPSGQILNSAGYEIASYGIGGISQVIENLDPNYEIIKSTYADLKTKERKAQYLTTNTGVKISISYGNNSYELAKIVGDKAMSLGNAKGNETGGVSKNVTGPNHLWYRKRYYYRVDKAYENQDFSNPMSYIDTKSYGLNGGGYDIRQESQDGGGNDFMKYFELRYDSDDFRLISFTDLFVGLEGDNTVITPHDKDNSKLVREIFSNKEKYSHIKISFNGHASYQGYTDSNNDLAKNRALTLRKWMKNFKCVDGIEMGEPKIINQQEAVKTNVGHVDDKDVKIWRSAAVIIEYEERNISNAATAESVKGAEDAEGKVVSTRNSVEIKNNETSTSYIDFLRNLASVQGTNGKSLGEIAAEAMGVNLPKQEQQEEEAQTEDDEGITVTDTVKRYDNEGEFFQTLTKEAPFLHHLITDKIKYFDPAFHSISPEGFNARLTFLHQCTRQGATVEDSIGQGTAYNLAFGRPPVCVLRLGDFYYTKIVIDSLQINYDTPQWDMNPEGIGMMPMFAKVTLGFKFLGGSDLAGPIARLQNAVSFNYYANTSVYDNRAEMVEYDPDGSGKEIKFKGYRYPNTPNVKTKRKKKGIVDTEEDLRWHNEFFKNINVGNAEGKQSNTNIINFDKNFR